ncbi:hypothetical protein [Pelobacter seleniigenes]|uniref:hypothetical protein n=1 Tax=Pelobacter seleniigenes TaxID=407188 RepID=UPI0004A72CD4|nr:hypothetical protein [Pelobacter seleniigenes]
MTSIREYGLVTITHNFELLEEIPVSVTTTGGSRWGSNNTHPEWRRNFHLWGKTSTGVDCVVDTDGFEKNLISGHPLAVEGIKINTWYFLEKERGDWQWTVAARRLSIVWLILLLSLVGYVLRIRRAGGVKGSNGFSC